MRATIVNAPRRGASVVGLLRRWAPLSGCNTLGSRQPEVALRLPPANGWQAFGLASLVAWISWAFFAGGQPVEVAAAREEAIREYVEERGMTRLAKTHLVTMPTSGRVEEIQLKEGDLVKQGATIARLVPEDLTLELRVAEAAAQRAQAAVTENEDLSLEKTSLKQAERYVES